MNTTAKLINWKEHGDMIILECELNGKRFEISTYKQRIYNAHLLSADVYIRLDSSDNIIGINIYKKVRKAPYSVSGLYLYYKMLEYTLFFSYSLCNYTYSLKKYTK